MLVVAVAKRLGTFQIDAEFSCASDGIVALFGRSGAGKTSLINMLAGLSRPDSGRIEIAGVPLFDSRLGLDLPPDYWWEMGGELENATKAQGYLVKYMPPCFALIVVLLVWQFNSFRRPTIILLTIPLTLIGVIVGRCTYATALVGRPARSSNLDSRE